MNFGKTVSARKPQVGHHPPCGEGWPVFQVLVDCCVNMRRPPNSRCSTGIAWGAPGRALQQRRDLSGGCWGWCFLVSSTAGRWHPARGWSSCWEAERRTEVREGRAVVHRPASFGRRRGRRLDNFMSLFALWGDKLQQIEVQRQWQSLPVATRNRPCM